VRSIQDVRTYLTQRGFPPAAAARAVSDCRTRGLLDDVACARLWAEHWADAGYASAAIHAKLAAKGFHADTIHDTTARLAASADDEARARLVANAFLARRGASTRQRASLARRLASRGFDPDVIERVLDESCGPPLSNAERTAA
jgi:SOS response regulatory protein OraA/RecX